jgi:hypothetical protein
MKKFTLQLFILFLISVAASAGTGNTAPHLSHLKQSPGLHTDGISFYSQDFAGGIPAGWQTVDSSGSQLNWQWTLTGASELPGTLSDSSLSTSGTTASNGYIIFDSDAGQGTFGTENSWLVSTAINAAGKTNVHLTFNEFFAQFNASTGVVWVSNDSVNWVDVFHAENGLSTDMATPNPDAQDIDISAIADNQPKVYIAFQWTGWWDYYWMVDDITLYSVPSEDVGIIDIWEPTTGCTFLTDTEKVSISIFNFGTDSISNIDVTYEIDGLGPIAPETFTDTIAPGTFKDYTFITRADVSAPGTHTITAYTLIPTDADMTNDTFRVNLFNGPHQVQKASGYTMGFEANEDLSGWMVLDVNSDGTMWQLSSTVPHTGARDAMYQKNYPGNATNDILFSTCLQLDSGEVYQASFWYRTFSPSTDARMRVRLYTDQTANSNILTIFPLDTVKNFNYLQYVQGNITVSTTGTYYVGWQVLDDSSKSTSLFIDDFNISTVTGVPVFGSNTNDVVVYPNPNNGTFTIRNLDTFKGAVNVSVIDMMGRMVYQSDVANQQQLDLNLNQPAGIYTVRISSDEGVVTRQISVY